MYWLIGQSNMAGRGEVAAQDRESHPRVFGLDKAGAWVRAADPLHFDKPFAGVGPGLSFGKAMAEACPDARIGLVPCAVGGSPIGMWQPGAYHKQTDSHPYDDALKRIRIALERGVLKGILWHQGEGDCNAEDAPLYEARLAEFIARVRAELDAPDTPFVVGALCPAWVGDDPWRKLVNNTLRTLPERVPHTAWASAEGLEAKADQVHFNAASARVLGRRYAEAMIEAQHGDPPEEAENPFERAVREQTARLASLDETARAGGAEALGYLRAYGAAEALRNVLGDPSAWVRREAAMSLAWCGGRADVPALLDALDDADWFVAQAAWVALTNLTGMEFPFDALAPDAVRAEQTAAWRAWWADAHIDAPPPDVLALLAEAVSVKNLALGCEVAASSTYKGPPSVLTDGVLGGAYWQTKQVDFPQHCVVDLGAVQEAGCVVVQQYGPGFCMTEYALEVSADGAQYETVARKKGRTPEQLRVDFAPRPVRYVRIVSFNAENRTYPTTFREIAVYQKAPPEGDSDLAVGRGLRALGALGGADDVEAIARVLEPYQSYDAGTPSGRLMVQAGLRALGRLGGEQARDLLVRFLDAPQWARYAADALGDVGDAASAAALIDAYPRYALTLTYGKPAAAPADDRPGLSPVDRMYETPYAMIHALARLPVEPGQLRTIAPLIVANMPGDFDGALLYEPEMGQELSAYLLERAGVRATVLAALFASLGLDYEAEEPYAALAGRMIADVPHAAAWLPALATADDVPVVLDLLDHENGWVRINAAKALMFLDVREAADRIAAHLEASPPAAEYGFYGEFRFYEKPTDGTDRDAHDEYNNLSPRWREAYVRALGRLGDAGHVPLLVQLLNDAACVLEVRGAAATALDELGAPEAVAALAEAEASHPYYSVRLLAREALWRRGRLARRDGPQRAASPPPRDAATPEAFDPERHAVVFIQGDNQMPNDFQIDVWRQTYSTTDSGPTYRLGRNLMRLDPDGTVTALTDFADGYVADCEPSWDGARIVFARRGGAADPWWHLFEVNADGSGLMQLTDGLFHDVQPAYLPDGRIVFSTSRMGFRDEYHGYLSTGLALLDAEGHIDFVGLNVGRDNEPAVLEDGRIVFSRLELFYSRLKTELTVHAVFPDGTKDVTLYGPERRRFWREVTIRSGERWWGEAPPRHRVLRLTQPQPYDADRVVCASTAGLTLTGPGRYRETVLPHDKALAVTTPYPVGEGRLLCAATEKVWKEKGVADESAIDLGLYLLDAESGALEPLYNDPAWAEFEPRPLVPRAIPPRLAMHNASFGNGYTGRLFCRSTRFTRDARVAERGKLVRVVEGIAVLGRHRTHRAVGEYAWRNHTGTHARVLGTAPLAADGSFHVEAPADRLLHVQVLDSDRRVVGNQQIWMYVRPGETRSCAGCHEPSDTAPPPSTTGFAYAAQHPPALCLPHGDEFSYRAKVWNKGVLPDEGEERTRTVRAVNLPGRY